MLKRLYCLAPIACALIGIGCVKSGSTAAAPKDPKEFLMWSMDRHKELNSFQADCEWKVEGSGQMPTSKRLVSYSAPNKFKVESKLGGALRLVSKSDGKKLVEFMENQGSEGQAYEAPESISSATSMQMMHPMFCGSLLYKFFAGRQGFDEMVDERKGKVSIGSSESLPGGETGRVVSFYAKGMYGQAKVLVSEKTGLVHRIKYDSAGLIDMAKSSGMKEAADIPDYSTTETYSHIQRDPKIDDSLFKLTAEESKMTVFGSGGSGSDDPPLPIGKPAPDFAFKTLDGQSFKLSALRGKPVFIDFWATWCPPCRESLPHTEALSTRYSGKLHVIALSDEDTSTIKEYVAEHKFTFRAARDEGSTAGRMYKVESIPTFVLIDAKGDLVDYQSGFGGTEAIDKMLEKVGIKS